MKPSSTRRFACGRIFIASAILILVGGTRTGEAAGCHVTDRPVLAKSSPWESWLTGTPDATDVGGEPIVVRPRPCQGEDPAPHGSQSEPSAASTCTNLDLPLAFHLPRREVDGRVLLPLSLVNPLERPPRPRAWLPARR